MATQRMKLLFFMMAGALALSAHATGLDGYDPVSYFTDGRPEQGSQQFTFAFDDTTYWFKSEDHRGKFAADPEKYVELGRQQVCGKTWSFPAFADGRLYVRDNKELQCFDLAPAK